MAVNNDKTYQQKVAEQTYNDAVQSLAESQAALKGNELTLLNKASRQVLSKAELEVLNSNSGVKLPEDRQKALEEKYKSLLASDTRNASLQKIVTAYTTEVKTAQLNLNSATNSLQVFQGKTGGAISPISDPAVKQPPYSVNYPTPGNGSILNNPTGLIVGTVALQAAVQNPGGLANLIRTGGSIFGSNNITPVTSGVPDSPAGVSPTADPSAAQTDAAQQNTAQTPASTKAASVTSEDPFEAQRLEAEARANEEPPTLTQADVVPLSDQEADALAAQQEENQKILAREATDVEPGGTGYSSSSAIGGTPYDDEGNLNPGWTLDENNNPVYVGGDFVEPATQELANEGRAAAVGKQLAQQQAAKRAAQNIPSQADWRVRISLAQGSNYLYNFADRDGGPGILAPLQPTNGVIFPYTPTIETTYHAKYNTTDLVHSNYRGYFYQNSYVDQVTVKGTFTAQDTKEAQYLLAVIHFFRSVTKMFYGATDQYAGTPPPLVYLSGFGQYQYKNHPCLVTNFNYSLPNDVDYIRADGFNNYAINLENRRTQTTGAAPGGILAGSFSLAAKLGINKLFAGGIPKPQMPGMVNRQVNQNKDQNSTYVPTKMEISVTLLPTQTRQQVSQQFSVKDFASGELLKKGFW